MYNVTWAPQGWQCPICKRVYSPSTDMCYYCGNDLDNTSTEGTTPGMTIVITNESKGGGTL